MLNHSCVANTKLMIRMASKSSARLEVNPIFVTISPNLLTVLETMILFKVRATVPVKAGSPLYISRADPLLDMHTR